MGKLFGYAGKLLRVDLTNEKITEEVLDEETARKYIGGTGLGAKYLYDEVPAGVEWFDADNLMTIATGPLGGTRVGGTGTVSVVTKGALTNGAVASQANGFFGAFLRFCGYDAIILQGKAKKWVYLYIHEGGAELRDASHLVGKDNWETTDTIKAEHDKGEKEMSVASIGTAGENLVKFGCIFFDKGHTASHNGTGAVMGSKKLKAIAVARGKGRPVYKDSKGLSQTSEDMFQFVMNQPVGRVEQQWGTLNLLVEGVISRSGRIPVKNYTTNVFDIDLEKLEKFWGPYLRREYKAKPIPCYACRMRHCHIMTLTEGPYKGYIGEEPEYESFAAFGPIIGNTDSSVAFFLANEADRLGMDCNEMGWTLGLAIECYEKGVISKKDTDGLELTWGNYEAVHQLMLKIARREGFGNVLAEGAMRAAHHIGGDAPNFAIHTMKGNTPRSHDHRTIWGMDFDTCVSQMSTDEGFNVADPEDMGPAVSERPVNATSAEDAVTWNVRFKGGKQFEDCLGVCWISTRSQIRILAQGVSAATGWDFSTQEAMDVGKRIVNLLRAFNIRHGHTAEMDAPSPRYGSAPPDGPAKGKSILLNWDEMRRNYYAGMGWDKETGKPLPETLKRYGIEYAVSELWGK
jgi:aldehyde:ferredoxin oxidoreductase